MDHAPLHDLLTVYRDGLLEDVLPFWTRHCVDRECGGFMMALDRDGTVLDTDKGMWQQGRFAWLLGELYNTVEPRAEWLELCRHGIEFITRYGFDTHGDGRMFFHVTRDGKPVRKRRYNFTESFAAIAFAEYAKATGNAEYRDRAIEAFESFVHYNLTPGAIPPKFTDVRPMKAIGFPMITIGMAQQLRDAIDYEQATEWIDRSIAEIQADFMKPELEVVMETVGLNGEIYDHFDGRALNPGHAIEGAWFILNEARHRGGDADLVRMGTQMLDWMWRRGWDTEYGGILYFRDLRDLPVQEYWQDMKFWWPQNEAIIATLLAYHLTGDSTYADRHQAIHDWTYRHFPDPECGEWFGYLHRDGRVSVPLKGNLWKGPFHIPRMQLYCWQLLEEMVDRGEGTETRNTDEAMRGLPPRTPGRGE